MFAREDGAVAAPTAALHFTPALLDALAAAGIGSETLTLHVGAGTFLPVKADDTDDHVMHAEWGRIEPETADRLNAVRAAGGRVIAVGTTSLRLLESAARPDGTIAPFAGDTSNRSEEHTSELQPLIRNPSAVLCVTKNNDKTHKTNLTIQE